MNRSILLPLVILSSLIAISGLQSTDAAIDVEVTQNASVIVQTVLVNDAPVIAPRSYVFIVQVEDESGIVIFLDYKSGVVSPHIPQDESIAWQSDSDGVYTVKPFVWSDLDNPHSMQSLIGQVRIDANEETKIICRGSASCFTGMVTKVVDGDTIDVDHVRIRLSLVDTPELGELGYAEASDFTAELCPVGSRVAVDQDDGQLEDDFGRMIAKVTCKGNKVLNAELVESGNAIVFKEYCDVSEFSDDFWLLGGCATVVPLVDMPEPEDTDCDPSYPDVCIPSPPPDLDCGDINFRNFRVVGSDPHRFDGDKDGVGCEA